MMAPASATATGSVPLRFRLRIRPNFQPLLWLWAILVAAGCAACGGQAARPSLCGPTGLLRVGLLDPREGVSVATAQPLSDGEIQALRDLLIQASRCPVELEPLASTERARLRLARQEWDMAFLPPGLTTFSLQTASPYIPVRTLGSRRVSRSSVLVRQGSPYRSVRDLNGAAIALLPHGSLGGFYLPLYNLHGLNLRKVSFALHYPALLTLLEKGEVDAIAWDEALPPPQLPVRRLQADSHAIPFGALVLSGALSGKDYLPFLRTIDANATALPSLLGYASATLPDPQMLQPLRAIVAHVEGWTMPLDGDPYSVFRRSETP